MGSYVNEFTAFAAATAEGCLNIARFYGVGFMCGEMGLWQPVLVMESGACSLDNISYEGLPTDMCRSYMFQVGGGDCLLYTKEAFVGVLQGPLKS